MGSKENVKKLKRAYQLWHETRGSSAQEWVALMADEVSFRSLAEGAPGMEFTQERKSKEEVGEYFAGLASDWKMHHYTPDRFIADGDWVVMLGSCKWGNRTTGKVVETPKADFFEFRDGKIVRFYELFDTAAALRATQPEGGDEGPAGSGRTLHGPGHRSRRG